MTTLERDAPAVPVFPRLRTVAFATAAFGAAAALWWRFGESVYNSSLMGAFLACF